MNNIKKIYLNYFLFFIIIIIFLSGIFLIQYYFTTQKNECINSPLPFGIREISKQTGLETFGIIYIKLSDGSFQTTFFNSTNIG